MKRGIKGGNTYLYKTRIKPKKVIRNKKKNLPRGGGVLDFLKNGLKSLSKKKIPSSLVRITKNAVKKGTEIAKRELRKPGVQNALKSAVTEGSSMLANRMLMKSRGNKIPSLRDDVMSRIAGYNNIKKNPSGLQRRKKRRKKLRDGLKNYT